MLTNICQYEGFDSCDRPSNLSHIEFKSSIFRRVWPSNLMDEHAKQKGTCSMLCQALCIILKPFVISVRKQSGNAQFGSKSAIEIPWMTLKNNRALFYVALSFVHHFIAIGEFKLELQSGNARIGSKSTFCPARPWNSTDDLENNIRPLLFHIKLCASFQSHRWFQTGVTVRKHPIRVKIGDVFGLPWPWNIIDDLENHRAPFLCYFKPCVSFHSHHWIQTGVGVRKRLKFVDVVSLVTLKCDGWH